MPWKLLTEVIFDGANGFPLKKTNEVELRRRYTLWLSQASGTPDYYVTPRPDVLRLFPMPNSEKTITIYGVRAPDPLSADTDYPAVPAVYHEGLCERAFGRVAKRWSRGDARQAWIDKETEYLDFLHGCKRFMAGASLHRAQREVVAVVIGPGRLGACNL